MTCIKCQLYNSLITLHLIGAALYLVSAQMNEGVGPVLLLAGLVALSRKPPGCLRDTTFGLPSTTSMWMIYRVHCHAPNNGPLPQPPASTSLAQLPVLVLWI